MIDELLARLDQLGRQLTGKEHELSRALARNAVLEKELASSQEACHELEKEAFRCSLLEQRLNDLQKEHQQLAGGLHEASNARASLDQTMTVVQEELARTQKELHARTLEAQEQRAYFHSMLEAKEASVGSLQQLLATQQRVAQEQQQLWEEEKAALKQALLAAATAAEAVPVAAPLLPPPPVYIPQPIYISPPAVHDVKPILDQQQAAADQRQQQEAAQQAAALKQRLLEVEADNQSLAKRVTHLESHLRDRERLLVKADKRYQELSRQHAQATGQVLGGDGQQVGSVAQHRPAGPDTMAAALSSLREVSLDRRAVQLQLELIQEAFEEESKKRDRLRDKLGSKLASKSEAAALNAREAEALRLQLSRVEQQLRSSREEAQGLQKQLDQVHSKQVSRSSQQLAVLKTELQDMQARHQTAVQALKAAHEATVAQERKRYVSQIKELETQLQGRLAAGGGRSLEEQAGARALHTKVDTLQSDLQERSQQAQQLQHTLYLLRAHWGSVKRDLIKLQHAVRDGAAARAALSQVAGNGLPGSDAQLEQSLSRGQFDELAAVLMRDWDPTQQKPTLDASIEECMMAGCQVLQAALHEWQALTRQAQHTSSNVLAITAAQQSNAATIQPLLAASQLQLKQAQEDAAAAERAASHARSDVAVMGERLAESRNQVDRLQRELDTQKEVENEYKKAIAQLEAECKQLKQAVNDAKGDQDAAVCSRDAQLHTAQRTIDDLKANVGVLHLRLEHMQANFAQVDVLKARLSSILASVPTHDLAHPASHDNTTESKGPSDAFSGTGQELTNMLSSILKGTATVTGIKSSAAEATGVSSRGMQERLEAAVSRGLDASRAAVAACALLETQQWELERGMEGVGLLRSQVKALQTEVSAGRLSTAQVLLQGLTALLDAPVSTTSAPAAHITSHLAVAGVLQIGSSPAQAGLQESGLTHVLSGARQAASSVISHAKATQAVLQAISQAFPEWVQLTRAEAMSEHRSQLSRVKAAGSQQLNSLAGQVAGSEAGLAKARAALNQYMESVEHALTAVRQQVDEAYAAGALPLDTPIRQQLDDLTNERQCVATRLTSLLQPQPQPPASSDADDDQVQLPGLPARDAHARQPVGSIHPSSKEQAGESKQAADTWAIPADHSISTQIVVSRPAQVRSVDQVSHLQGALTQLHSDKTTLESDRLALLSHVAAIRHRAGLLLEAVQAVLPVPEDLVLGLQDGLLGWVEVSPWQGDEVVHQEGQPGQEAEAAAHRLLTESTGLFKQLVGSFLQQVEAAAHHNSQQQVQAGQVAPLQARCAELETALLAARADTCELQEQVASLVKDSAAGLEEARDACIAAANTAFDAAMESVRQEVLAIEGEVVTIKEAVSQALESASEEWAATACAAASSAAQAVTALRSLAERLQGQLAAELKAHDATRAQAVDASRAAAQQSERSEAELSRTKSQLEVTRQQLSYAETGQDALEQEASRLRQTIRQHTLSDAEQQGAAGQQ